MKKLLLLISMILALNLGVTPAIYAADDAGQAARYLRMGVGARPLGMGGAYIAVADDSSATYWNPAGLSQLKNREVQAMYSLLSLDRNYNFLNYVQPFGEGRCFGLSLINFGVEDIRETRSPEEKNIGYFDDKENTLIISYADNIYNRLLLGGNLKYLTQSMNPTTGKEKAEGFGFDLGLLWIIKHRLSTGLIIQDIGTYLKWSTGHKDRLPVVVKLGTAWWIKDNLLLAMDVEKVEKRENLLMHIGGEYRLSDMFSLRAGAIVTHHTFPTAGFSITLPEVSAWNLPLNTSLHYAFSRDTFSDFDDDDGFSEEEYSHRLSLGLRF